MLRTPAIVTVEQKPSALLWQTFQWNACSVSGQGEMTLKERDLSLWLQNCLKLRV